MKRLLIIGIDGLDFDYVTNFIDQLPNIQKLQLSGCLRTLKSVFPPDSIPAWVTIFTGLQPVEHGIVDSVDYMEKNFNDFSLDNSTYAGKTFWDVVGNEGYKVCVVNPFMAYPVWEVNGIMVSGPVFVNGKNMAHPKTFSDNYPNCPALGGIEDNPKSNELGEFINKCHSDAQALANYTRNILLSEPWDLGFVSFFTMDRIQHFLWRYCHKDDPTYPGSNIHENAISDHYRVFDYIIGQFIDLLQKDDRLIVISDHGHGMRCTHTLNLNEFLRRKGYLHNSFGRFRFFSKNYWIEKVKNFMIAFLYFLKLEELIYKIGRLLPNRKKLKSGEHAINQGTSIAWVPNFAGCGPYGGIAVSTNLAGAGYKTMCDKIINDLNTLNKNMNGTLFKWIRHRDFLQDDGQLYHYPDILFELYPNYGVNWSLFVPLVSKNYFHRRLSGGHKWNGVFASSMNEENNSLNVSDVYQIVLNHYNIKSNLGQS